MKDVQPMEFLASTVRVVLLPYGPRIVKIIIPRFGEEWKSGGVTGIDSGNSSVAPREEDKIVAT